MVAAAAAKAHSLQGCRMQQHKSKLNSLSSAHYCRTAILYGVLKKVLGEGLLQMILIA